MQKALPLRIVLPFIALAAGIVLLVGPPLGEHETIVALIARETLQTGHWLIPQCMDAPFLIKPPLPPWAVAAAASILPNDAASGLPVTALAARLPSMIATALTVAVLYLLSRSMFGLGTAALTAFIYGTSVGAWLFAVNATAEALLTLFSTWAFAEFWWAQRSDQPHRRRLHLLRFYAAFGLAMLAKGPMPLTMLAIPLAVYFLLDRPTRLLAAGGPRRAGAVLRYCGRRVARRCGQGLTTCGLWWGIPIVLLMFLPWMVYVARHEPYVWRLWYFEYLLRVKDHYPGEGQGGPFYYLPLLFGLAIPWALSLPEGLAAPFLAAYRGHRKALTFAWFWAITGTALMSSMTFKKPYYILPAMPACALLLTPVLARLFDAARNVSLRAVRATVIAVLMALLATAIVGGYLMRQKYPEAWDAPVSQWAIPACVGVCLAGFSVAGVLYARRRFATSLGAIGLTSVAAFALGWSCFGPILSDLEDPMQIVDGLNGNGAPRDQPIYWVSNRPDTRVVFYGHRPVRRVVDTDRLVAEKAGAWNDQAVMEEVAGRVSDMLNAGTPVWVLFQRGQLQLFRQYFSSAGRELFSINRGTPGHTKDDFVVITNRPPAS